MRVFNNGNTVVEVSVKTRKNSGQSSVGGAGGGGAKWDGILQSQDEATQQVSGQYHIFYVCFLITTGGVFEPSEATSDGVHVFLQLCKLRVS